MLTSIHQSLLIALACALLFISCGSKTEDVVAPTTSGNSVIPGAPDKFKNPEGYMTLEIDGKPLEMGISISSSQLRADQSVRDFGHNIYGSISVPNEGVKSISITMATKDEKAPIHSLIGVHKSSDAINGNKYAVNIYYSIFDSEKRSQLNWASNGGCTVEIISTTSPWIEGTFTIDSPLTSNQSGLSPVNMKKGVFKIRYEK